MHCVALPHVQPRHALTTYTTVVLFQPCMIGYTQYAQTPEYTQPPDPPRLQDTGPPGPPRLQDPPGILCLLDYDHSLLACFAEPRRCRLITSE